MTWKLGCIMTLYVIHRIVGNFHGSKISRKTVFHFRIKFHNFNFHVFNHAHKIFSACACTCVCNLQGNHVSLQCRIKRLSCLSWFVGCSYRREIIMPTGEKYPVWQICCVSCQKWRDSWPYSTKNFSCQFAWLPCWMAYWAILACCFSGIFA